MVLLGVMDHFNATIKDGKLVKTRRGLQVSRQKFNGLSFVNASPQESTPSSGPSGSSPSGVGAGGGGGGGGGGVPGQAQPEIIFVDEGSELYSSEGTHAKDAATAAEHPDGSDASSQGPKRRRRPPRRGKSPATPTAATPSPSRRSPTNTPAAGERAFPAPELLSVPHLNHTPSTAPSTPDPDPPLSAADWALFERYFDATPRSAYPFEDLLTYNPLRGPEFRALVVGDMAALHCVLVGGSIADAVARDVVPRDLAHYIAKICAILNRKLGSRLVVDAVTLYCIAELARVGCSVGRLDHWTLHMRGLKKVLDVHGGLANLPQWLVAAMHKADLHGAATLAIPPHLPFTRRHGSIAASLPPSARARTRATLASLLNPLGINPDVTAALSSLALLASAVRLARGSDGGGQEPVRFEPNAFVEEGLAVREGLLTRPGPLREVEGEEVNLFGSEVAGGDGEGEGEGGYMGTHRLVVDGAGIRPVADGGGGNLEAALRVAGLLVLKELLPEWPRNLGGYAVLLWLLRYHLGAMLGQHRRRQQQHHHHQTSPAIATTTSPPPPPTTKGGEPPAILSPPPPPRPILLLLALLGTALSHTADTNERRTPPPRTPHHPGMTDGLGYANPAPDADGGRYGDGTRYHDDDNDGEPHRDMGGAYPRGVYRGMLREMLGLATAGDIDALREADTLLLEVFECGMIFGRGGVDGEGWDWRGLLREVLVRA